MPPLPTEVRGAILGAVFQLGRRMDESQVYEARCDRLASPFAVKLFAPDLPATPFRRGAQLATALRHPGIVQAIDYNWVPGASPFLAMELVAGARSLAVELAELGHLPRDRALPLLQQIAAAVSAGHDAGVFHHDLRPDQILLCPSRGAEKERARVLGFGVGRVLASMRALDPSPYLAPEIRRVTAGSAADARADQFALAAIAYHMLSGTAPRPDPRRPGQQPAPIREVAMDVGFALDEVICEALSSDPEDRFSSVVELARRIEEASEATVIQAPRFTHDAITPGDVEVEPELDLAATPGPELTFDDEDAEEMPPTPPPAPVAVPRALSAPFRQTPPAPVAVPPAPCAPFGQPRIPAPAVASGRAIPGAPAESFGSRWPAPAYPTASPGDGFPQAVPEMASAGYSAPPVVEVAHHGKLKVASIAILALACIGALGYSLRRGGEPPPSELPVASPEPAAPATPSEPRVPAPAAAPSATIEVPPTAEPQVKAAEPAAAVEAKPSREAPPPEPSPEAKTAEMREASPAAKTKSARAAKPASSKAARASKSSTSKPKARTSAPKVASAAGARGGAADPASAGAGQGDCVLSVTSKPPADLVLDGKRVRRTPVVGYKVPCGEHKLQLKRDDLDLYQMEVISVARGKPFKRFYPLR